MKAFLEEYGILIAVIVGIAALIFIASQLSKSGQEDIVETYNNFTAVGSNVIKNASEQVGTGLDGSTGGSTGGTTGD